MKYLLLWCSILTSIVSLANTENKTELKHPPLIEDYSLYYSPGDIWIESYNFIDDDDDDVFTYSDSFNWLYEILFPLSDRSTWPNKSRKSFNPHLKDSFDDFPHPDDLKNIYSPLKKISSLNVSGTMKYVVFFPRKYKYDVFKKKDGSLILEVRVHFKQGSQNDLKRMQNKMNSAANIWNSKGPTLKFNYSFRFLVAKDKRDSHFSVNLIDSSRGPYDVTWAKKWNANTIAHELGHMMGLGDEYQTLTGTIDCLEKSLMCHSWYGKPMKHHYYHILKRFTDIEKTQADFRFDQDEEDPWGDY